MTRVLLLTAGFGDGHNTAARNIRLALEQSQPGICVETADIFRQAYGVVNTLARHAYHGLINHAPSLWNGLYWCFDRTATWNRAASPLRQAARALAETIARSRPDCILATYPAYAALLQSIFPPGTPRPFLFGVVVTDSVTINAAWYAAPADFYCVPNEETGEVLCKAGVGPDRVHVTGFPVCPAFCQSADANVDWEPGQPLRVLLVLNHGTRKAVKTTRQLLRLDSIRLTVVTGRNRKLQDKLAALVAESSTPTTVLGWTDRMPELMRQAHLVISKAGGATVQETLAAGRPVILNQVVPGQEEGNAAFIEAHGMGAVASRPREVPRLIHAALKNRGALYRRWRWNVERHRRPAAALDLARQVLLRCKLAAVAAPSSQPSLASAIVRQKQSVPFEWAPHAGARLRDRRIDPSALFGDKTTPGFGFNRRTDAIGRATELMGGDATRDKAPRPPQSRAPFSLEPVAPDPKAQP